MVEGGKRREGWGIWRIWEGGWGGPASEGGFQSCVLNSWFFSFLGKKKASDWVFLARWVGSHDNGGYWGDLWGGGKKGSYSSAQRAKPPFSTTHFSDSVFFFLSLNTPAIFCSFPLFSFSFSFFFFFSFLSKFFPWVFSYMTTPPRPPGGEKTLGSKRGETKGGDGME